MLEQLHINLWFFDFRTIHVDTGLLVGIPKDLFTAVSKLDFSCHMPFSVNPYSVQDLFSKLEDETVLRLLFNDEVATKVNVCC